MSDIENAVEIIAPMYDNESLNRELSLYRSRKYLIVLIKKFEIFVTTGRNMRPKLVNMVLNCSFTTAAAVAGSFKAFSYILSRLTGDLS